MLDLFAARYFDDYAGRPTRVSKTPAKRTARGVQGAQRGETTTIYFGALEKLAEHYFAVWNKERAAVLRQHAAFGEYVLNAYNFTGDAAKAADAFEAWLSNRAGTRFGELVGTRFDEFDDELRARWQGDDVSPLIRPAWELVRWLTTARGHAGGVLGLALTGAFIPIVSPREVVPLLAAAEATLRERPPVAIMLKPTLPDDASKIDASDLVAIVLGHDDAYGADAMPSEIRELFVALADAVDDVREQPASVGLEGETVRAAYHAFAPAFWEWHKSGVVKHGNRGAARISQIPAGDFLIPSANALQGVHRAIISRDGWSDGLTDFPYYDDAMSGVRYSIGGIAGDGSFDPKTDAGFQADLAAIDPKMSLAYAAVMGAWTQAYHSNTLLASGCVAIHVNEILELRGVKRHHSRDYKTEQKRETASGLHALARLRVRGESELPNKKRVRMTGQLLEIVEAETDDLFGFTPYGFLVRPGAAVQPFFEASPQFATFFRQLAQLDVRQGIDRIAYHVGLYLAFQWRIRQSKGALTLAQPFKVRTLLEGSRLTIETNAKLFSRFREQVDAALDRLREVGVVGAWEYESGDEDKLPVRGWFRPWLEQSRFLINAPPAILEAAQIRTRSRQGQLPPTAAKRRRKTP